MSIASLQSMGAFTGAPVEKDITWSKGGQEFTATIYVKPLSYSSAVSSLQSSNAGKDGTADMICYSICDEDGKPIFTPADLNGEADPERGPLDGSLTVALLGAIGEVNGLGKSES